MPSLINDYFIKTIKPRLADDKYPCCHTGIRECNGGFTCCALSKVNIKTLFIEWLRTYFPYEYKQDLEYTPMIIMIKIIMNIICIIINITIVY